MRRTLFEPEHEDFRESVRRFLAKEVAPHYDEWERDGHRPARAVRRPRASTGFLAHGRSPRSTAAPGVDDFRFNVVVDEELMLRRRRAASGSGLTLHNDICLPYFLEYCNEEQRERWLPGIASGELITAIAMTEPGTGSDLARWRTTRAAATATTTSSTARRRSSRTASTPTS